MVWYGMVNVNLYSALSQSLSCTQNTLQHFPGRGEVEGTSALTTFHFFSKRAPVFIKSSKGEGAPVPWHNGQSKPDIGAISAKDVNNRFDRTHSREWQVGIWSS